MEKRAGLYVRVSTLEQAQTGYSVGEQKARLLKYAEAQNYKVIDVYSDEGVSGKSLVRPAIDRLINDIKDGKIDIVLIYKLDRLSRRVKDVLELVDLFEQNGVSLFSLNENIDLTSPFGRASLKISATFSEFERETIVERMIMGKDARAKMGLYSCPGKCPFGYILDRDNDCFIIDEEKAIAIRDIFTQYLTGKYSFRSLYDYIKTKYPNIPFFSHAMTCKDIVERPLYAGYFVYKGELIKAINVPPIIDYETYLLAQEQVKRNTTTRNHDGSPYLLTGLIYCAKCGRSYCGKLYLHTPNSEKKNKNANYSYRRYGCIGRIKYDRATMTGPHCDNSIINAVQLEEYIEKAIANLEFTQYVDAPHGNGFIDSLIVENAELQKKKDRLLDLFVDGSINKDTFTFRINEIEKKIAKNNTVIEKEKNSVTSSPTVSLDLLKQKQAEYPTATLKEKRRLVNLLIKSIVVDDKDIFINWRVK